MSMNDTVQNIKEQNRVTFKEKEFDYKITSEENLIVVRSRQVDEIPVQFPVEYGTQTMDFERVLQKDGKELWRRTTTFVRKYKGVEFINLCNNLREDMDKFKPAAEKFLSIKQDLEEYIKHFAAAKKLRDKGK